jgi:DNA recombination protein RmuC
LSTDLILIVALAAVVIAVALSAATTFLLLSRRRAGDTASGLPLIQHQLDALRSEMAGHMEHQSNRLEQAHATVGERLDQTSRTVSEVGRQLGRVEQATQRVLEVGQSVAGIENLLRAPKLRGVLGETLLAEILRQSLPASLFKLQHQLKSGERVDAAIQVGEVLLPVDAKFPLENLRRAEQAESEAERASFRRAFGRDFRKHVDDIALKYIAPEQGTLPLAFLYIPAENVYQQAVLADWQLAEYALARRVIPTGPLGFYAFLQTVLLGARAMAVSGRSREILAALDQAALELERAGQEISKLRRHLDLARSGVDGAEKRLGRLAETIDRARHTTD